MALNDEATLMVRDRPIGGQMVQIFLEDLSNSREVSLAEFRRRAWLEKMMEQGSKLIMRLL